MKSKRNFPKSDHCDGTKFFNPTLPPHSERRFFQALKMWYGSPRAKWPEFIANQVTPCLRDTLSTQQAAVTFINHATFLIQLPGLNILTDPIWSYRASPFKNIGPARVHNPGVALADLPHIHLVLVSHNHYDHLDCYTLQYLEDKFSPQFIVPLGDKPLLTNLGCTNIHEVDWWDVISFNATTAITFTPTQHDSARTLWDRSLSLWGSYVINHGGKLLYFGGDAGYSGHFQTIAQRIGSIDLALLAIGSYEPSWFMHNMHMNPLEAVQAHLELRAKNSIGMHFGTFQLSAEAIDQPLIDLNRALQQLQVDPKAFITMLPGTTRIYTL